MQTSENGYGLIRTYESLSLKAYPDPATGAEPITIGYGSTNASIPKGESFKLGDTIDQATAERWMKYHVTTAIEPILNATFKNISQNQFDALVSFVYNLGIGNVRGSTLFKKLGLLDYAGTQPEFLKWINANGKPMRGLKRRRLAEAVLFGGMTRTDMIKKYFAGVDPDIK